jgi:hypothetical protein
MGFEYLSRKSLRRKTANSAAQEEYAQPHQQNHLAGISVMELQHLVGNQRTQHIINGTAKASLQRTPAIQREDSEETEKPGMSTWSKLWERTKDKVGLSTDNEKVLEEFQGALEKSQKLCEYGSMLAQDDDAKERLSQAAEKFGGVAGTIETTLDITGKIGEILAFVDAVNAVADVDIEREPHKAAQAFGNLFATAGTVGQMLPDGPWTAYFEWMAEAGDFFTNMVNKIVPQFNPQHKEQWDAVGR